MPRKGTPSGHGDDHSMGVVQETSSSGSGGWGEGRLVSRGRAEMGLESRMKSLAFGPEVPRPSQEQPGCRAATAAATIAGENLASCVSLNRGSRNNAASCGCPPAPAPVHPHPPGSSSCSPVFVWKVRWHWGVWVPRRQGLGWSSTASAPGYDLRLVPAPLWASVSLLGPHEAGNGTHLRGLSGRRRERICLCTLLSAQGSSVVPILLKTRLRL